MRDYGNGANTQTGAKEKKKTCGEDQRLVPDGFGGKVCKDKVVPLPAKLLGGADAPSPPPPPQQKKQAAAAPTRSSSSTPVLSFDELLANSIKQKEGFIGRELTAAEKDEMKAKLQSLMGK